LPAFTLYLLSPVSLAYHDRDKGERKRKEGESGGERPRLITSLSSPRTPRAEEGRRALGGRRKSDVCSAGSPAVDALFARVVTRTSRRPYSRIYKKKKKRGGEEAVAQGLLRLLTTFCVTVTEAARGNGPEKGKGGRREGLSCPQRYVFLSPTSGRDQKSEGRKDESLPPGKGKRKETRPVIPSIILFLPYFLSSVEKFPGGEREKGRCSNRLLKSSLSIPLSSPSRQGVRRKEGEQEPSGTTFLGCLRGGVRQTRRKKKERGKRTRLRGRCAVQLLSWNRSPPHEKRREERKKT